FGPTEEHAGPQQGEIRYALPPGTLLGMIPIGDSQDEEVSLRIDRSRLAGSEPSPGANSYAFPRWPRWGPRWHPCTAGRTPRRHLRSNQDYLCSRTLCEKDHQGGLHLRL